MHLMQCSHSLLKQYMLSQSAMLRSERLKREQERERGINQLEQRARLVVRLLNWLLVYIKRYLTNVSDSSKYSKHGFLGDQLYPPT